MHFVALFGSFVLLKFIFSITMSTLCLLLHLLMLFIHLMLPISPHSLIVNSLDPLLLPTDSFLNNLPRCLLNHLLLLLLLPLPGLLLHSLPRLPLLLSLPSLFGLFVSVPDGLFFLLLGLDLLNLSRQLIVQLFKHFIFEGLKLLVMSNFITQVVLVKLVVIGFVTHLDMTVVRRAVRVLVS